MKKEQIMEQLYITQEDIDKRYYLVIEKLYLTAIINQGTEVAAKILKNFVDLRNILMEKNDET